MLSTCSFRRLPREVWIFQKLVHKWLIHLTSCAHFTVLVVLSFSSRKISNRRIYEHVSRTGIKVVRFVDTAVLLRRYECAVADAADILTDSGEGGVDQGERVLKASKWRSLSSNLLFGGAEIINSRLASSTLD